MGSEMCIRDSVNREIRVGTEALQPGYWGVSDRIDFSWEPSLDPESAVASYVVELIQELAQPACGSSASGLGKRLSRAQLRGINCDANASKLYASLDHGGRYHLALTAVNGIGLNSTVKSNSFVVDLSETEQVALPVVRQLTSHRRPRPHLITRLLC